jgi:hypothetical protein
MITILFRGAAILGSLPAASGLRRCSECDDAVAVLCVGNKSTDPALCGSQNNLLGVVPESHRLLLHA